MPTPTRFQKFLRFALALLILAALFSGLRLWLDARGRAILAKFPSRTPAPQRAAGLPGSGKKDSIPVANVPLFAGIYSTDPAVREAHAKLLKDLEEFRNATYAEGVRTDGRIDFLVLLRKLSLPTPNGMTQAQAATAFLAYAKKLAPFLASLHAAADGSSWNLGPLPYVTDRERERTGMAASSLLMSGSSLLTFVTAAHLTCGQPGEALATWQDIARLSRKESEPDNAVRMLVRSSMQAMAGGTIPLGFGPNGWRDADLAAISLELESSSPLDSYRRGIQGEREAAAARFAEFARDPASRGAAFESGDPPPAETLPEQLKTLARHLGLSLMSDTQIAANAAVIDHRWQVMEDAYNYDQRRYLPPSPGNQSILRTSKPEPHDFADAWYFALSNNSPTLVHLNQVPIKSQTQLDQTRLALALETQRRATGTYPDTLDALAPAFPGGLPHDIATGQPYFYQKTPDGTYRLWGTGVDQTNDSGDAKNDLPFKLPKPQ